MLAEVPTLSQEFLMAVTLMVAPSPRGLTARIQPAPLGFGDRR
jgi:hypothetical protein